MAGRSCLGSVLPSCSEFWSGRFRRPMSPPRYFFTCPLRPVASNQTRPSQTPRASEREPVATVGIDLVVRVHAGAPTQTCAHGSKCHSARAQVVHAETGDEIETAFDARKALKQPAFLLKIVDQCEDLRTVAADIEADGRAAPVDFFGIKTLADEPARAVAQPDDHRARPFLALDVGVRLPKVFENALYGLGHDLRRYAKEVRAGLDDFVWRKGIVARAVICRRRSDAERQCRKDGANGRCDPQRCHRCFSSRINRAPQGILAQNAPARQIAVGRFRRRSRPFDGAWHAYLFAR